LAYPYSEAAYLRENVLSQYANKSIGDEINIRENVIANLETLEKIIKISDNARLLEIKLAGFKKGQF
jgi:hypothetical protein